MVDLCRHVSANGSRLQGDLDGAVGPAFCGPIYLPTLTFWVSDFYRVAMVLIIWGNPKVAWGNPRVLLLVPNTLSIGVI